MPSATPTSRRTHDPETESSVSRHANGYGGLTETGDYEIDVAGDRVPPAPWANIIANPSIGFCITERGGGFAWAENSHFFRLTPWFNDPVSDPVRRGVVSQGRRQRRRVDADPRPDAGGRRRAAFAALFESSMLPA